MSRGLKFYLQSLFCNKPLSLENNYSKITAYNFVGISQYILLA